MRIMTWYRNTVSCIRSWLCLFHLSRDVTAITPELPRLCVGRDEVNLLPSEISGSASQTRSRSGLDLEPRFSIFQNHG
jgi:hypothetical protein